MMRRYPNSLPVRHTTGVLALLPHSETPMSHTSNLGTCARCDQPIGSASHYREPRLEGVLLKHATEHECCVALQAALQAMRAEVRGLVHAAVRFEHLHRKSQEEWVASGKATPKTAASLDKATDDLLSQVRALLSRGAHVG